MSDALDELWDRVGRTADKLDNLIAGSVLPMPVQFKFDQTISILGDAMRELRSCVVAATGEDPWAEPPADVDDDLPF